MPIDWIDDFATNDDKIDDQHRQLFRFANKLETFLHLDEPPDAEIQRLLRFLEVYLKSHFQYEETCMLKRQCPVAKANHQAHKDFLETFERSVERYQREGYSRDWIQSLHSFVAHWLTHHICHIDAKLRDCP